MGRGWRYWCHSLLALLAVFAAASSPWSNRLLGDVWPVGLVGGVLLPLGGGTVAVARAVRVPQARAAWSLLAGGMLVHGAGSAVLVGHLQPLSPAPFPSVADGLWLAACAGYGGGLLLLAVERARPLAWSSRLDGAICGLATAAVGVAVAGEALRPRAGGSPATAATGAAHPVGDVLLLATVVTVLAVCGWRPSRSWWLLGLALVGFAVADTLVLAQASRGSDAAGDVLRALPFVLLPYAAIERRAEQPVPVQGRRAALVPALCSCAGFVMLAGQAVLHLRWPAVALAAAVVSGALLRLVLTVRQGRDLVGEGRLARTDDLTGLANRRAVRERVQQLLAAPGDGQVAVLLLDLDRFKEVNDALGHEAGDDLLVQVAGRMAGELRSDDVLGRLGGDEFAVTLTGGHDAAQRVAQALVDCLHEPFLVGGSQVGVGVSLGVAVHPDHGDSHSALLRAADIAMYQAKRSGGGVATYQASSHELASAHLELVTELRQALAGEEVVLHYQPQVDLASGHVTGAEALVRWQHPTRGLLAPSVFLPLLDRAGLEAALTRRVLDVAVTQAASWLADGACPRIAVNICVRDLLDDTLPGHLAGLLQRQGVPPSLLVLEVTENDLIVESSRMVGVLDELRRIGVSLSVDDFGTGYSSLRRLRQISPTEIKIDRSFIGAMAGSREELSIVAATIELGHNLGMRVVAEGVETHEDREQLRALGCDDAQGYLFSPALPPEAFRAWLLDRPLRDPQLLRPLLPAPRREMSGAPAPASRRR